MASSIFIYAFFLLISATSSSKLLLFPLTHSLSNSELLNNTHHLLKSTTSRSITAQGGDYTISFSLGSAPKRTVTLYMDTGSDTVWLPCKPFTCIMCEGESDPKTTPPPQNLSASAAPVTCQSRACSAVHSTLPTSDLCAMARCPLESIEMSECHNYSCPSFYYAYGDGSFVARLYKDNLEIPMSSPPSLVIKNFTFGCAHESLGEPIGVAGFGRGALSLPAQLAVFSPHLGTQFSYCLVSHSFETERLRQPSPLILGRVDSVGSENKAKRVPTSQPDDFAYTPMLENSKHPYYYYVGLEAITVGNHRLPAPENMKTIDRKGNGGMVVDSGTTYSMLPEEFYNSVVSEFAKRMKSGHKRAKAVEDRTGLSPCYYVDEGAKRLVPQMVLHFGGNSSVVMPRKNYFYEFMDGGDDGKVKRKAGCMMVMNGGYFPESGGPAGLLGNYQQQGLEVVYDLLKKRMGFARRNCASLWERLS
ncbi:probable aspartyl protease At4g16563 [Cynara cardunculus var. scolymus]|nr:probable aspartyl protease At4g16563 [Cynara cardunculus var. scolymus]